MDSRDELRENTEAKLKQISASLALELNELEKQGALSELDKKKLISDATIGIEAVRDALERIDYPIPMQKELIDRLILNVQRSVNDITVRARSKLYSEDHIRRALSNIESTIFQTLDLPPKKRGDLETKEMMRIRDSYVKRIKLLAQQRPPNEAQINYTYQDYRNMVLDLARAFVPKIDAQPIEPVELPYTAEQTDQVQPIDRKEYETTLPFDEGRKRGIAPFKLIFRVVRSVFKSTLYALHWSKQSAIYVVRRTPKWLLVVGAVCIILALYWFLTLYGPQQDPRELFGLFHK